MIDRRALLLVPFGVAAIAGVGGYTVLSRMKSGTFDPTGVPSQLIGRPVPDFDLPAQEVFAFAGVWRPAGEVDRFAFLTTAPNELVGAIHPKAMPMILAPHEYTAWLTGDFAAVCAMSDAYPDDEMRIIPD